MNVRCLIIVIALLPPVSLAAGPLDCVDPDIARTLLGTPGDSLVDIQREWPERFPPVVVPDAVALIGSRTSQHFTLVSFKSALDPETARDQLADALQADGWKDTNYAPRSLTRGFQTPMSASRQQTTSYCHDEHGQLAATAYPGSDDGAYLTLMAFNQTSAAPCHSARAMGMMGSGAMEAMPQLSLPEDVRGMPTGFGTSGGGDNAATSIELETGLSGAELLEHFGRQLSDQGWREEGRWTGQTTSGSAWSREAYSGVLRVASNDDDRYKLHFDLMVHR